MASICIHGYASLMSRLLARPRAGFFYLYTGVLLEYLRRRVTHGWYNHMGRERPGL